MEILDILTRESENTQQVYLYEEEGHCILNDSVYLFLSKCLICHLYDPPHKLPLQLPADQMPGVFECPQLTQYHRTHLQGLQ